MPHDVELRTAHDVRHLRTCDACGDLGDDRRMIYCDAIGVHSTYHDDCVISAFTIEEILRLPLEELNKFTLHATGVTIMKKIMKKVAEANGDN